MIDRANCAYFKAKARGAKKEACAKCREACSRDAVDFAQEDTFVTEKVGAIVVATGFELYLIGREQTTAGVKGYGEYGYGSIPDVIGNGIWSSNAASASGPTGREDPATLRRPGAEAGRLPPVHRLARPRQGDRLLLEDLLHAYVAKHTTLDRHKVHDGQATVFYMDVRAAGKGYDEFTRRARRRVRSTGAVGCRGSIATATVQVVGFDRASGVRR